MDLQPNRRTSSTVGLHVKNGSIVNLNYYYPSFDEFQHTYKWGPIK